MDVKWKWWWMMSVPKEIPIISHNGSNYVYHFYIKELAEGFEGQLFRRKYLKIHNFFCSNRRS